MKNFYVTAQEKCQDIDCIRIEVNRINSAILKLLSKRTALVMRAGDIKSQTTRIADDRQRVIEQEKNILKESKELGLPSEIVVPTFRAIIENSILFQQKYIDQLNRKNKYSNGYTSTKNSRSTFAIVLVLHVFVILTK